MFNTFLGLVAGLALSLNLSLVARVEDCLALPVAHLGQTGSLSLVEVSRGCALIGWIVMLLCQLSYAVKPKLKAPKALY